ncbi:hypothetical protein [Cellulosimicrobium sp. Marseille-Q4280]|uniref:hypothetical protein n=1 Tax=Cellulosimicrobium sp. Marseille-Q4280 TaxID=2937992 RepID=UPI002040CDEF|nr:hypothetical protein [Cellulosimicrobium sp. Marseille-Q4280]
MPNTRTSKRAAAAAAILGGALLLGGCDFFDQATNPEDYPPDPAVEAAEHAESLENEPNSHGVFWQELPEGGQVQCIWAQEYRAGCLSCDWASAERPS